MSDSGQNRDKAPYQEFSERLTDAMLEAGYAAREGSWSRLPVEIEPLRREAQAKRASWSEHKWPRICNASWRKRSGARPNWS